MSLLYHMKPTDLISTRHIALQMEWLAEDGGSGDQWAGDVAQVALDYGCTSVLDYGCGHGRLKPALQAIAPRIHRVSEYDPAIPGKQSWPEFADLVVCTNVLEHVEPEKVDRTLNVLKVLARKAVFVAIATYPADTTLSDGRNAHLTVASGDWWHAKMRAAGFTVNDGPSSDRAWVAVLT